MLHNIGLDYEANTPIVEAICEHTGGIGVGIFFFLSAYGITRSYQKKWEQIFIKIDFCKLRKTIFNKFCN